MLVIYFNGPLIIICVITHAASEQSAAELQKVVLAKAGEITDVVASIGSWDDKGGPLLNMKAEELDRVNSLVQS